MNTTAVRAASVGFTLLLIGELVARSLAAATGVAGPLLPMASALAYTVAGMRATSGRDTVLRPELTGALAAAGAYALTVPLRLMAGTAPGSPSSVTNVAFAAAVGAAAARIAMAGRPIPPNGGSEDPSSALPATLAVPYRSSCSGRGWRQGGAHG